jgi:ribonucleotide reductase beta subunit family protein with ferritin-like domain
MMNENFCAEIFQEFFSKWVSSQQAQSDAFQHIENLPSLVDAVDMVKRTQSKLVNFSERLVILLLVKTVILCTIFAALLKYKNILPTLAKAIELVIQDNIRFGECLVLCYLKLSNKLTKTQLKLLIQDASKVEIQLMTELNIRPSRKHESYTRQFVEFVSDFWAQKLDMENLFGATKNPLKWTTLFYKENDQEWQQLKASAQSTESSTPPVQLVSSSSSSVLATSTQIERQFSLDDDF